MRGTEPYARVGARAQRFPNGSYRRRTTPSDAERRRTTPNDAERRRTTPSDANDANDAERLSGPS
jgi:hypothetical protein